MSKTKKLNNIVCHISYLPVMIVVTVLFIILNIIVLPFAYFKGIIVKIQFLFNGISELSVSQRIASMIVFII